jgi:hypothetical protein
LLAPPQSVDHGDFETIEAAVMETERGRWFLAEFARRRHADDIARLLAAIDRLEARAVLADAGQARARLEADRAVSLLADLASLLRDLRPSGDPRAPRRPAMLGAIAAGELERRLAALAQLDGLDVETKLNLLG